MSAFHCLRICRPLNHGEKRSLSLIDLCRQTRDLRADQSKSRRGVRRGTRGGKMNRYSNRFSVFFPSSSGQRVHISRHSLWQQTLCCFLLVAWRIHPTRNGVYRNSAPLPTESSLKSPFSCILLTGSSSIIPFFFLLLASECGNVRSLFWEVSAGGHNQTSGPSQPQFWICLCQGLVSGQGFTVWKLIFVWICVKELYRIAAGYMTWESSSAGRLVAVFSHAAVSVGVVGLGAFALNAGPVHGPDAAELVVGVTPTAQARLQGIKREIHWKEFCNIWVEWECGCLSASIHLLRYE